MKTNVPYRCSKCNHAGFVVLSMPSYDRALLMEFMGWLAAKYSLEFHGDDYDDDPDQFLAQREEGGQITRDAEKRKIDKMVTEYCVENNIGFVGDDSVKALLEDHKRLRGLSNKREENHEM